MMKLPAGLSTKPDWLRLSEHVVTEPSVPQLTVWKLIRELAGSGLTSGTGERRRRPTLENTGAPGPAADHVRASGAPGIGPLQP